MSLSEDDEQFRSHPQKEAIKAIACGGRHNLVLTKEGILYSFGFGQQG